MLARLIDWLLGCSVGAPNRTWSQFALEAARCVLRTAVAIAVLYAAWRFGVSVVDAL